MLKTLVRASTPRPEVFDKLGAEILLTERLFPSEQVALANLSHCKVGVHCFATLDPDEPQLWQLQEMGAEFYLPGDEKKFLENAQKQLESDMRVAVIPPDLDRLGFYEATLELANRVTCPIITLGFHRPDPIKVVPHRAMQISTSLICRARNLFIPHIPVRVFPSDPLLPTALDINKLRVALRRCQRVAFDAHPALKRHLGSVCIRGCKEKQFQPLITDSFAEGKTISRGMALAIAWELSTWIKSHIPGRRVGVLLPPGIGGMVTNLACVLADRSPVNLNPTAGQEACESAISQAGLVEILTAAAVKKKVKDFPWTDETIDIALLLKATPKWKFLLRRILIFLAPARLLDQWIGVPREGNNHEVGLLFTSGSSGLPKGVALSHRNILSNTAQVANLLPNSKVESILGCLPLFHSFGFTVTIWWPLIGGPRIVSYVSPLDVGKIIEAIDQYDPQLMITTPTFLRSYTRKATKEQMEGLKLIITGAEKLPLDVLEGFENKFDVPVCEGYGITETTPVIGANYAFAPDFNKEGKKPLNRRIGSVGRMMPGLEVQVRHPETNEVLPLDQTGHLTFKGANVFQGYLHQPNKTAEILKEGWYYSGDIGRYDVDGFLFIEGRISRFSKIAGEMVPHGTVEQKIILFLKDQIEKGAIQDDEREPGSFVMGIPDASKGEALVALTTHEIDQTALRNYLSDAGVPNLWIPKQLHTVDAIPTLASGKLDLRNCKALLDERM